MSDIVSPAPHTVAPADCTRRERVTKSLLGYGVFAGPFYVALVLGQAWLRPGFDLTHDDASLLSNGPLGWIQIANFVLTGAMVVAFAVGVARSGFSRWAPRLLAGYGLGILAAGIFVADPMGGFPPGTPAGRPEAISWHGMLHIVVAAVGFLCLVSACFVAARRFAAERRRGWSVFSVLTGSLFLLAFAGVASGSTSVLAVLGFWVGLIVAWAWLAAVAVHLYRRVEQGSARVG